MINLKYKKNMIIIIKLYKKILEFKAITTNNTEKTEIKNQE